MKVSKKAMSWMLVATVFVSSAAACSDDAKTVKTTAAPAADAGDTGNTTAAPAGDAGTSSNPDVVAFCKSADDLADQFKKVMADPASGDITALSATATDLSTKAATLSSSSPADANAISACLQKMSTAMTGG
ncbi:MAG TPA: hypothetical protein PK020_00390 [Ilumatobacteraceae bacterium]|nr:hypothetical protein [Ilumatobacteraceae bacterium]HRB04359.1 hypothetical protein [Ilumatobacteraceae bacterium]